MCQKLFLAKRTSGRFGLFHVAFASLKTPIVDVFPDVPGICAPTFAN
jgi:hypothetical protein